MMIRIVAPHFVAGVVLADQVERAAPIVKYMIGWNAGKVRNYARSKGWQTQILEEK